MKLNTFFRRGNYIKWILLLFSLSSILFLAGIVIVLFLTALPLFAEITLKEFLLGDFWSPLHYPPKFGILPLILGTLWVTIGAMFFSVPLGICFAIYMAEVAPPRIKELLKPTVEVFAGIPSVIYGFFGMVFLAPFLMRILNLPIGLTALTASLLLGIMALPTIISISEDAITSVPKTYKEASYSLGATRLETTFKVVLPAAAPGIITAIILGMGRAIGETMTVLMVAGGAAVIPQTLLEPVRPMTAAIALEMGEAVAGSNHHRSLFAIAGVLFLITFFFSLITNYLSQKFRKGLRNAP